MGFFKSLFSSNSKPSSEVDENKSEEKNFDILKYDGVRAQRIHKMAYAIRCFEEALNIKEDFETMSFLTATYIAASRLDDALRILDRMRELQPQHVDTILTRIQVLFMLDKDADVIPECLSLIEIEPEDPSAYYLMAKAKHVTGDLLGAVADLTRSISLKDDFAGAYQLRAELLLKMQQGKEALADVEKVLQLNPDEDTGYLLRGKIYLSLGDMDKADADFHQVLTLNPFSEEAVLLIAQILMSRKQLDEAISFLDEAIETSPDQGKFYSERGRAKNMKGDKAGAFEDLKKAVELNPDGEEVKKLEGTHSNFDNLYSGGIY